MLRFLYLLALIEERSDQLVTVLSATISVFVGFDSNHFRYVTEFRKSLCKVLVEDVPGGVTADYSEHFWTGMFGGSWCWMACCIPP